MAIRLRTLRNVQPVRTTTDHAPKGGGPVAINPQAARSTQSARAVSAGLLVKISLLGLLNALGIWAGIDLTVGGSYGLLIPLVVGLAGLNMAFLYDRAYPLRYLLPAFFLMGLMVAYPVVYTAYVAFTNYGTGHILSKEQVIAQIGGRTYLPADAPRFQFTLYRDAEGSLGLLLQTPEGEYLWAHGDGVEPLVASDPRLTDTPPPAHFGLFERLPRLETIRYVADLEQRVFQFDQHEIRMRSATQFTAYAPAYLYDAAADAFTDQRTGVVYTARDGAYWSPAGERLNPGYRTTVGWRNFHSLFTNPHVFGPFARVFAWTVQWAFLSVITTFSLGLFLAILLNDSRIRGRAVYRTLLIIPYAVPGFISALMWRGFFNTEVGIVNRALDAVSGVTVPWLQDPFYAKVALVIVNLWLGFPYMMLLCLGALQSIQPELYEAATVDGAGPWQSFRYITLPLLLVALMPILIASFAYNFNNFTVVYLLTEGRPPIPGAQTPAGSTDILISYTYRLAFESGRGADYGLASAVTIIIFLIIATISWFNFRFTRALEDVKQNA